MAGRAKNATRGDTTRALLRGERGVRVLSVGVLLALVCCERDTSNKSRKETVPGVPLPPLLRPGIRPLLLPLLLVRLGVRPPLLLLLLPLVLRLV